MEILHVIPYFHPAVSYGGPVNVSRGMTRAQQEQGHSVRVLTTDACDLHHRTAKREDTIDGVHVTYLPNVSNRLAKTANAYLPLGLIQTMRREMELCEVVHIHEYFTLLLVAAVILGRKRGRKMVLQSHGSIVIDSERGRPLIKKVYNLMFERLILSCIDEFLVLSFEERDYIRGRGVPADRIHLVSNGVSLRDIDRLEPVDVIGKYSVKEPCLKLVYLGRINFVKGLDILVETVESLKNRERPVKLFIAGGDDGYMATLQRMIAVKKLQDHIMFTGELDAPAKLNLLRQCDLYIQTSRSDVFSVSAAEAICMHTPVVVAENVGISRLVKDRYGIVVPYDPDTIAEQTWALYSSPERMQIFADNAARTARDTFSWHNIVQEIAAFYQHPARKAQ